VLIVANKWESGKRFSKRPFKDGYTAKRKKKGGQDAIPILDFGFWVLD
jgi:hypothetical protein